MDSAIPLLTKSEISGLFSVAVRPIFYAGCMMDLVGKPENRFSHNEAHISPNMQFVEYSAACLSVIFELFPGLIRGAFALLRYAG